MSMKGKPNTSQFKTPKDPTAFLEGGEADKAENRQKAPAVVVAESAPIAPLDEDISAPRRGRVQKIFNFPEDLADRLRDEAQARTREKGRRVTEKDIVVEALEKLLTKQ